MTWEFLSGRHRLTLDRGAHEVLVARVHRLEPTAVDRHDLLGEEVELAANSDELATGRPDRSAIVRRKSAMVLKSGLRRAINHNSSMFRCVSRSSRRLDETWFR
jgi:hypothetical protein